jgi:isopentenyl-diphosphate delta-isomerase
MKDTVILVNKNDEIIGFEDKLKAHVDGKLHRAFSITILNSKNEMLIQKRSSAKYHSGGLWSNACCSHQTIDMPYEDQIHNRLFWEMGFDCQLEWRFNFIYRHAFENNLIEYEYDHVYAGFFDGYVNINPEEIDAYQWADIDWLIDDIKHNSDRYTVWFRMIIENNLNDIINPHLNKLSEDLPRFAEQRVHLK